MPLLKRPSPFDDPDWLFELKYDGFRALAVIEHGRAQLISRNGHPFASFAELAKHIAASVPNTNLTVLDGEIVCIDKKGKPQFRNLLFHRGDPCFFAFDVLTCDGKDWRGEQLIDRKQELRRLLARVRVNSRLKSVEHIDGSGTALFHQVCELDLEGIVAKHKFGPYITHRENSTWYKIRNREYSQIQGREKLFERDRHREPVAGWHSCALACEEWGRIMDGIECPTCHTVYFIDHAINRERLCQRTKNAERFWTLHCMMCGQKISFRKQQINWYVAERAAFEQGYAREGEWEILRRSTREQAMDEATETFVKERARRK
jgi:hypothetical protein